MLGIILEVDELLQKTIDDIDYINGELDFFVRAPIITLEYMERVQRANKSIERIISNALLKEFESQLRNAYLTYEHLDRLLDFLTIISGRIGTLTDSLLTFYDNLYDEIDKATWLNEDQINELDELRGNAKSATIENYYKRPYFEIGQIIDQFLYANSRKYTRNRVSTNEMATEENSLNTNQLTSEQTMRVQTKRLESMTNTLQGLLRTAKYELRNRWDGSLESAFMRERGHYWTMTEIYNNEKILVLDPQTFESEIKINFIQMNDVQKSNYIKLLRNKKTLLSKEKKQVEELLLKLKLDIENGKVNELKIIESSEKYYANISYFVVCVENEIIETESIENIIDENISLFCSDQEVIIQESQTTQFLLKLQWPGDKNELTELIFALYKSQRIRDANTGQAVKRDVLIKTFESLLGVDLKNFDNLLSAKLNTYRARDDGKTFLSELKRYVDERSKGKNQ